MAPDIKESCSTQNVPRHIYWKHWLKSHATSVIPEVRYICSNGPRILKQINSLCFEEHLKWSASLWTTVKPTWCFFLLRVYHIFWVRPCERWNFLNFSFSWVLELFGYQSLEIFWKNQVFLNSQKFGNKFGSKTPVFGSKKPVIEAKTGVLGSKTGVSKYTEYLEFVLLQIFRKLQKMMSKSNLYFREKVVPTPILTWIFKFESGMQGLTFELLKIDVWSKPVCAWKKIEGISLFELYY